MKRDESTAMLCKHHRVMAVKAVVRLLLEKGADVNSEEGEYGDAL